MSRIGLLILIVITLAVECSLAKLHALYSQWGKVCNEPGKNHIKFSTYGPTGAMMGMDRNWTLNFPTIHDVFKLQNKLKLCESPREVANSVINNVKDYTCSIEWLDEEDLCSFMSKYSQFYFVGDSLTRHMLNAFHIMLSGDLETGAFPNVGTKKQPPPRDYCRCDGQFSEWHECRQYLMYFTFADIRQMGYCESMQGRPFGLFAETELYGHQVPIMPNLCTPDDPRPKFFFLQGGSHYEVSSYYYYELYLHHQLTLIREASQKCSSHAKPIVVFSGVSANSAEVARKYPDQTDSRTMWFNREIADRLKIDFPDVITLDFWNLTHEMVLTNRTSDGLHQLTDSNLIKMMALLNVAKLATKYF